jgi:hypothetical protein
LSKVKEIKRLCGGVVYYAAQASAQIDDEIGQKDHLWMETNYLRQSICIRVQNLTAGPYSDKPKPIDPFVYISFANSYNGRTILKIEHISPVLA